jgi:beta-galactosidase
MRSVILAALVALAVPAVCQAERQRIDLNGSWQFRIDPQNQGERDGCYSAGAGAAFDRTLAVPGSWQAQGVGEPRGFMRHDYAGPAWYRRTVAIPANWRGQSITLRIGGAHRYTTVFLNGKKLGEHRGFSSPFSFDATDAARPGGDNVIAIRIENPGAAPVEGPREQEPHHPTGLLNYIGNWGGIYGSVELRATDPVHVEQLYVRPDVAASAATFVVRVKNGDAAAYSGEVKVAIAGAKYQGSARVEVPAGGAADAEIRVPMPNATLWSPDQPHLYTAAITLGGARVRGPDRDRVEERFGLRQFTTKGNVLLLNGKPLYLRGYGDDNIEVLGGFPPSSRAVFFERLKLARSFGFNAVRFHSMTPPEEYFHAADEAGLLVMAELPAAYTQYVLPHKDFLREELQHVVLSYRNRPSFLSLAFGNEFNLTWLKTEDERKQFLATVADFYALAKKLHPDGLLLSNDGYVMKPTDLVSHYGPGLPDLPTVKHEFGEYYCSLPDISLIDKFTGLYLPEWLHVKKKWVDDNALGTEYATYVRNSMRLQHLGRKYQIERVRRQQDVTGYHYWLIVDYPGGTGEGDSWEEGWFDYFWRPKGITPREGQEINAAVLPLIGAGVGDRSIWSGAGNGSGKPIDVIVSNYGQSDLRDAPLSWKLLDNGQTVTSGQTRVSIPMGAVKKVSPITLDKIPGGAARKLELVVDVNGAAEKGGATNRWTFWSFPREGRLDRTDTPVHSTVRWAGINRLYPFVRSEAPAAGGSNALLITSSLDESALAHLRAGGRVWLMAEQGTIQPRTNVDFFPAAGGAQGTVVRSHAALEGFPHEGFADLQFFNLMDGAVPVPLDKWARDFQPIVGGIRTTAGFLAKTKNLSRVGYVFEGKVGQGRLLVTTLRFREHLDEAYPEAIALFDRLLRYASGASFAPSAEVGEEQLQALMPPR